MPFDTGDVTAHRTGGTIRYWAAAKEAAGVGEEGYLEPTLGAALDAARARHAEQADFARILGVCSCLVDGEPVGSRDPHAVALSEGGTVEVLPPFAGG